MGYTLYISLFDSISNSNPVWMNKQGWEGEIHEGKSKHRIHVQFDFWLWLCNLAINGCSNKGYTYINRSMPRVARFFLFLLPRSCCFNSLSPSYFCYLKTTWPNIYYLAFLSCITLLTRNQRDHTYILYFLISFNQTLYTLSFNCQLLYQQK